MERKNILFVYRLMRTWINTDLSILRKNFNVTTVCITKNIFKDFYSISKSIRKADIVFIWFAGWHAFFTLIIAKIFNKKTIVVVGGYDVAYNPEIRYGNMSFWRSWLAKYVLKNADKVLPFSNFALGRVLNITSKSNSKVIPLVCRTENFVPKGKKENIVLTVCFVTKENIKRKGLETFAESAKRLPNSRFILAGKCLDKDAVKYLQKISPKNLEITGYLPENELIKLYQKAKVYCQLSYQEGEMIGGALGEAMACECIPVVSTKALTLRETVGDCGFYVPYGDAKATVKAIKKAFKSSKGKSARKRMLNFSIKKREEELIRVINEVLY